MTFKFSVYKQDKSITLAALRHAFGKIGEREVNARSFLLHKRVAVFPYFVSSKTTPPYHRVDRHLFEDGKRCACMLSCSHKKGGEKERPKRKREERREKEEQRIKNSFTACP